MTSDIQQLENVSVSFTEAYISVQPKDFKIGLYQRALGGMLGNPEAFESKACIAEQAAHFHSWWNDFQKHRSSEFTKQKLEFQKYGL